MDGGELYKEMLYYSAMREASGKSVTFEDPKVNQIQERYTLKNQAFKIPLIIETLVFPYASKDTL